MHSLSVERESVIEVLSDVDLRFPERVGRVRSAVGVQSSYIPADRSALRTRVQSRYGNRPYLFAQLANKCYYSLKDPALRLFVNSLPSVWFVWFTTCLSVYVYAS